MAANIQEDETKIAWDEHLRTALTHLYDPTVLGTSQLIALLKLSQNRDRVTALRTALLDAIETLRPGQETPQGVKSWRVYHILRRRYTEQMTQIQVASDLGLSKRQLQREEKIAREVLAERLCATHQVDPHLANSNSVAHPPLGNVQIPTRAEELAWLQESIPQKTADVRVIIANVLETLHPLQDSAHVQIQYAPPDALPGTFLRPPLLRQALLDVLTWIVEKIPRGTVLLGIQASGEQLGIHVRAIPASNLTGSSETWRQRLRMAEQLVRLCGGKLQLQDQEGDGQRFPPVVCITLPIAEQTTVLIIDDNADALRLFESYLSGTRYRFAGTQRVEDVLALAEELAPPVIVLDVMMPRQDGWSLLGQLREHPATQQSAFVVCTILAQEQLAWALGAAAFIRKPVRREQLLEVLDRLLAPPQQER